MSYAVRRSNGARGSAQAYRSIGLETQVMSASPEKLITLLFDGARAAIAHARLYLEQENVAARGQAISKALDIVDNGLKASLDLEKGGEVAKNLQAVYEIVSHNLLLANLNADMQRLDLADRLLADIGEAWRTATAAA
ncbi:flagellar export chaperone FliS [Orrella sp. JC864]|uniref:flagellar export chaperone FliS n=1 Tax=Orrella sp. JC864 TaxID=3120298 RepID=UPI0012BC0E59